MKCQFHWNVVTSCNTQMLDKCCCIWKHSSWTTCLFSWLSLIHSQTKSNVRNYQRARTTVSLFRSFASCTQAALSTNPPCCGRIYRLSLVRCCQRKHFLTFLSVFPQAYFKPFIGPPSFLLCTHRPLPVAPSQAFPVTLSRTKMHRTRVFNLQLISPLCDWKD